MPVVIPYSGSNAPFTCGDDLKLANKGGASMGKLGASSRSNVSRSSSIGSESCLTVRAIGHLRFDLRCYPGQPGGRRKLFKAGRNHSLQDVLGTHRDTTLDSPKHLRFEIASKRRDGRSAVNNNDIVEQFLAIFVESQERLVGGCVVGSWTTGRYFQCGKSPIHVAAIIGPKARRDKPAGAWQ